MRSVEVKKALKQNGAHIESRLVGKDSRSYIATKEMKNGDTRFVEWNEWMYSVNEEIHLVWSYTKSQVSKEFFGDFPDTVASMIELIK